MYGKDSPHVVNVAELFLGTLGQLNDGITARPNLCLLINLGFWTVEAGERTWRNVDPRTKRPSEDQEEILGSKCILVYGVWYIGACPMT